MTGNENRYTSLGRLTPAELRQIRRSYGLSQGAWAKLTGFSLVSISRWETGHHVHGTAVDRYFRLLKRASVVEMLKADIAAPDEDITEHDAASASRLFKRFGALARRG